MLSEKATDLNIALCNKIEGPNYVIMSWDDMFTLLSGEDVNNKTVGFTLFEELRLNACISLKYKDDEQACFAMTDKSRVITQEMLALLDDSKDESMVKTDKEGNAIIVVPKTKRALNKLSKGEKNTDLKTFITGLLGGILGGGIIYVIIYLVDKFI